MREGGRASEWELHSAWKKARTDVHLRGATVSDQIPAKE